MRKVFKRLTTILMVIIITCMPIIAHAHDSFFIQALYDMNSYNITVNVVEDKASWWGSEKKHIENELGNFYNLRNSPFLAIPTNPDEYNANKTNNNSNDVNAYINNMVFTFPSVNDPAFLGFATKNNATADDANRAYLIKETLAVGMNDAIKLINGRKFTNTQEYVNKVSEILSISQANRVNTVKSADGKRIYVVKFGQVSSTHKYPKDPNTNKELKYDPITGVTESDYVTIVDKTNGETIEYEFIYRMPKGYSNKLNPDGTKNPMYRDAYENDIGYISWQTLAYQASYSYFIKGYTAKDAGVVTNPGPFEQAITALLSSLFTQLRNLLGLYSNTELIFNNGIRGSNAWVYGTMPKSWADNVTIFFWLFEAMALALIMLAIVKALIQRNLATINTSARVSLIESIQDLIITGFILANVFPLMQMFMILNEKLVNVFSAVSPNLDTLNEVNNYSNAIGGVIMQFFYFIINIYLNFVYIMRALTLAILMASAPLFIVTLTFGGKWKQLFGIWIREFLCNVFLQSFHAFILGFFLTISVSSRGIEGLIVAYALIPLTEFFKGMVMGQGGGFASNVGLRSVGAATGMIGGAISGVSDKRGDKKETSSKESSRESSRGESSSQAGGSERIINKTTDPTRSREAQVSTMEAHNNRTVPIQETTSRIGNTDFDFLNEKAEGFNLKSENSNYVENLKNIKGIEDAETGKLGKFNDTLKTVAKSTVSGGLSAGKVMAGVAAGMALGGTPQGAHASSELIKSGMGGVRKSITGAVGSVYSDIQDGYSKEKQLMHEKEVADIYAKERNTEGFKGLESELYSRETKNGEREVHRDSAILAQEGLTGARIVGDKGENTQMFYDYNKLSSEDKANIHEYAKLWKDANSTDSNFSSNEQNQMISHLKKQGVEDVQISQNGNIAITYNQNGLQKLGIKSAYSTKDGRLVETKRANDPTQTAKSFQMEKFIPKQPVGNHKSRDSYKN